MNKTILEEAAELTSGERHNDYGHPFDDFTRTARLWSPILGTEVTPEQVALCMIQVKVSRECNAHKRDNLVDIAGYANCLDKVVEEKAERIEKMTDHFTKESELLKNEMAFSELATPEAIAERTFLEEKKGRQSPYVLNEQRMRYLADEAKKAERALRLKEIAAHGLAVLFNSWVLTFDEYLELCKTFTAPFDRLCILRRVRAAEDKLQLVHEEFMMIEKAIAEREAQQLKSKRKRPTKRAARKTTTKRASTKRK